MSALDSLAMDILFPDMGTVEIDQDLNQDKSVFTDCKMPRGSSDSGIVVDLKDSMGSNGVISGYVSSEDTGVKGQGHGHEIDLQVGKKHSNSRLTWTHPVAMSHKMTYDVTHITSQNSVRHRSEIFVNPEPKITHLRKQTNKAYVLPYRFVMPASVSKAKLVDDLYVAENHNSEIQAQRRSASIPLLSLIHHDDRMCDGGQNGNIRDCSFCVDKTPSVGMLSNVHVTMPMVELRKNEKNCLFRWDEFSLMFTLSSDKQLNSIPTDSRIIQGYKEEWKAVFVYPMTPSESGLHTLHIQDPDGNIHCEFKLDVVSNNPVLSFNDGSFWPVSLVVDDSKAKRDQVIVYVAYSHHISEFLGDGRYIQQLITLDDGFYNQLALASHNNILAACVSCWIDTGNDVLRNQRVYLYHALSGRKLYTVGGDIPVSTFMTTYMSVSSLNKDHIIIVDGGRLCQMNIRKVDIETRLKLKNHGTVARVCHHDNKYYVADAATGQVKIYDAEYGQFLSKIQILDNDGNKVAGLKGMVVDKRGNIIVSDCLSGGIWVYTESGKLLMSIKSDWEPVRWPLDIAVETNGEGYVYVVDHGNMCIKKFRYL